MRNIDTLLEMENISILCQYLYMNENNYILIDNGIAKIEIRMTENGFFKAKNLNFPDLPDLNHTKDMTVPNMLAIINQLRGVPAIEYPDSFENRWEEIRQITLSNLSLNLFKNNIKWNKIRLS